MRLSVGENMLFVFSAYNSRLDLGERKPATSVFPHGHPGVGTALLFLGSRNEWDRWNVGDLGEFVFRGQYAQE